jgi:hypothetical protein
VRKGIALLLCLPLVLSALASVALSAPQRKDDEILRKQTYAVTPPTPKAVFRTASVAQFIPPLPKLVLPNVSARVRSLAHVDRSLLPKQLRKSEQVIAFFAQRRWVTAPAKQKCWEVPWQRLCTKARAELRLHHALAEAASQRLAHELPLINDWVTAVRYVQKIYPGTESWMLYISDREGGYGPWVWYGGRTWSGYHIGNDFLGSDTVGGWMQFRFSTFAPYYRGMVKDMNARGFTLPEWPNRGGPAIYQPWLDPLAQALTAGYMRYYGKDACHWCL